MSSGGSYRIGIDMGGTFTDAYMLDERSNPFVAKAPTDPADLLGTTASVLDGLGAECGLTIEELLPRVSGFVFATTLTTNLLVTESGTDIGLITTRGHGDVLLIAGGVQGKIAGLSDDDVRHSGRLDKPHPLANRRTIREIDERIDYKGDVLAPLNEGQVAEAARDLRDAGVSAVAICFLWSFKNPAHERAAAAIVAREAPDLDITCSHDLVPRLGEYLRFSSAAINAYCGPTLRDYLAAQTDWLRARGLAVEPLVMQAPGGVLPASLAASTSLYSVGSGPVAGIVGSAKLGHAISAQDIICTDMGGTTFDVGLVKDGAPVKSLTGVAVRYPFYGQIVDVTSIGSGGGSIAWVDDASGVLKVGPQSAGAFPGPACYARGGERPTVTDANLVLGYIAAEHFLGGTMPLDLEAAKAAIETHVGAKLGLSVPEAADAIYQITNGHMADFLRRKTIENGFDPRDFCLFAYGGAGALHASALARELGVTRVVIPLGNTASVFSAVGVLSSDMSQVVEIADPMTAPFDDQRISANLEKVAAQALDSLDAAGADREQCSVELSVDMRYVGQTFDVEVPLNGALEGAGLRADTLLDLFDRRYSDLYGEGAGYRAAGAELLTLRATAVLPGQALTTLQRSTASTDAVADEQRAVFRPAEGYVPTPVFAGANLSAGAVVDGPAVIELAHTSVVLHEGDRAEVTQGGTIEIGVEPA